MNSDLTPDRPASCPCSPPSQPDWRAASAAHHALFEDPHQLALTGEIWTVRDRADAPDEELLLVVVMSAAQDAVSVVPVSTETRFATEWDLLLPAATLGYPAIAQPKLAGTIAPSQLDQRLSSLMPESARGLTDLLIAAERGTSIPPDNLPLGPWVLSERDERLRVRASKAVHLQRSYLTLMLTDPASEWQSLGAILVRASHASGLDLAVALGSSSDADQLRTDRLDLFEALPPRKMARLLAALRIAWTQHMRDAVYQIAVQLNPTDVAYTRVLGRRQGRRGRSPRARPPQRSHEQAASDYVDAVGKELEHL